MKNKIRGFLYTVFPIIIIFNFFMCSDPKPDTPSMNLIIFTLDTTRADYIDTGSGAKAKTPNIKEIAKDSLICRNAFTIAPITMPAHTSMFTGLYPFKSGVYNNGESYDHRSPTLNGLLKQSGFKAAAVISLGVLNSKFGFSQDFEIYKEQEECFVDGKMVFFSDGSYVTGEGLKILQKFKKDKFYLWLHYSDPHEPYAPPVYNHPAVIERNGSRIGSFNLYSKYNFSIPLQLTKGDNIIKLKYDELPEVFHPFPVFFKNFKVIDHSGKEIKDVFLMEATPSFKTPTLVSLGLNSRINIASSKKQDVTVQFFTRPRFSNIQETTREMYIKEIEYMDSEIGKIIDFLKREKLYNNTVIALVGDHGEGLGEYRNYIGHKNYLNPQFTKIPLLIRFPGKKREVVNSLVSIMDITPTLLDYFSIKGKIPKMDGESIFNLSENREIFAFTYKPQSKFNGGAVISGKKVFIIYPGKNGFREFFDLELSEGYLENDNVIENGEYAPFLRTMQKSLLQILKKTDRKNSKGKVSKKTREMLESLGYL